MMLFVMLFSAIYVAAEAHHECTGEHCHICARVHQCESILRGLGSGLTAPPTAAATLISVLLTAVLFAYALPKATLVSSKVRLND